MVLSDTLGAWKSGLAIAAPVPVPGTLHAAHAVVAVTTSMSGTRMRRRISRRVRPATIGSA